MVTTTPRARTDSIVDAERIDLGANNGFNAIQMLRVGAREVVALDRDDQAIAQARVVKELFEWADGRSYPLTYVGEDMATLPQIDRERFDLVTGLCAIYYLPHHDIQRLVRHVSTLTHTFVLHGNTDRSIRRSDPETFEKASLAYAVAALRQNGFPSIRVVAPRGYCRPFVIGRRRRLSASRVGDGAVVHASGSGVDPVRSGGSGPHG